MSDEYSPVTKTKYKITRTKGNATSSITTTNENLAYSWLNTTATHHALGITVTVEEIITTTRKMVPDNGVKPNGEPYETMV